ncbi:phospholipase D-like domain-containing protein [Phyllobacterium sp. P30BS-XVII]|uniref:phospholipase D-like domain-containing protein n=1 Tax=Phyllobacterium sp. P30BS-XVII TaxID=2587046 RepID=UPI0017AD13AE|nr:phospholipase D-like domain-containing protein [Phyllobacterium sp. P30BS-XVII]MBA8899508.1 phosphatidylserine/phosphatidylglycerophosphate/cardiolipin synthase-like enzyme [Phyllobacterium sp. P30BS-XVII]
MMDEFFNFKETDGFRVKLWRGEYMCLLGFDVDAPEDDFVGFAVEYKEPKGTKFLNLRNRIAFDYGEPAKKAVTGGGKFPTTEAPLQMFRWVHFPYEPQDGIYTYRITKMHMPEDGKLVRGTVIELPIRYDAVTYDGFLDIGFTRNFASSQAFEDKKKRLHLTNDIIPANADDGLAFASRKAEIAKTGIYDWLGFEAHRLLFGFLDWAVKDPTIEVDALAYDLNEPDFLAQLEKLGSRLRVIIDDSGEVDKKTGKMKSGHGAPNSGETAAAARLAISAGADHVKRGHFRGLQHNKVLIAKRNGVPVRVLGGSMNFSFRGFYIQANNLFIFDDETVAGLFEQMFMLAFTDMANFHKDPFSKVWHSVKREGRPAVHICFSPHKSSELSLQPVGGAIDQATSSVFYSFAFMNQTKSGPVREALDRLIKKPLFSYGVVDKKGGMEIQKPSGENGLVDFAYLAKNAPEPFKSEWSGGSGINIHHKFAVVDFDKPTAKVFTGSSNFSPSGEIGNGDHLVIIEDQRVATAFAIEALRMFDHLNFRNRMQVEIATQPKKITLKKPKAISGEANAWFDKFYVAGSQRERDRLTFSRQS